MKKHITTLLLLLLLGISPLVHAQFAPVTTGLVNVSSGAVAWGDYDSDGDLDLVIRGRGTNGTPEAHVYRNDNGTLTQVAPWLYNSTGGTLSWGDLDLDGDLDLLSTGTRSYPYSSNGGDESLTYMLVGYQGTLSVDEPYELDAPYLPAVSGSSNLVDYDNDGDQDIVLTGYSSAGQLSNTAIFEQGRRRNWNHKYDKFVQLKSGISSWADYDNDGDHDLLLVGNTGTAAVTKLYKNNGEGLFNEAAVSLPAMDSTAVDWADYDNDGDVDLLLSGRQEGTGYVTKIYNNQNGVFTALFLNLPGVSRGTAKWGDYDNDGDSDVLVAGFRVTDGQVMAEIYRNDGSGVFAAANAGLNGLADVAAAWADYDNDNDLDLLMCGTGSDGMAHTYLYRNGSTVANTLPSAPVLSAAQVTGNTARLNWSASTDAETPSAGLSYNLYLSGSTFEEGVVSRRSALSKDNGFRQVVELGNAAQVRQYVMTCLKAGDYTWKVQAVDAAFAGSAFSAEGTFSISQNLPSPGYSSQPPAQVLIETGQDTTFRYVFAETVLPVAGQTVYIYKESHGTVQSFPATNFTATLPVVSVPMRGLAAGSYTVNMMAFKNPCLQPAFNNSTLIVNSRPTADSNAVNTSINTTYIFKVADFKYKDVDRDYFEYIKITQLPAKGALTIGATAITLGQVISSSNFSNIRFKPVNGQSGSNYASFKFQVGDRYFFSANSYTMKINVAAAQLAPVLANLETTEIVYTGNRTEVPLTTAITVADDQNVIKSALVAIAGSSQNCTCDDVLKFTNQNGITGVWNQYTRQLTLTGTATPALYQQALRSIKFSNNSNSIYPNETRTVTFSVNDGTVPGNNVSRTIRFLGMPTVTSFAGTSGPAGTSVEILGTNFHGVTAVRFGGSAAVITYSSGTRITAIVPAGASTGYITVTTPGGTGGSAGYFVVEPTITSFADTAGVQGDMVTITGTALYGALTVKFNGEDTPVISNTNTQITVEVPYGATSGRITVVTPTGTAVSAKNYTVLVIPPTITSFTPAAAEPGTWVTITGTNLQWLQWLKFNGVEARVISGTRTEIIAEVPMTAANTGRITLLAANGTATSATDFTVLPFGCRVVNDLTATPASVYGGFAAVTLNWECPSDVRQYTVYYRPVGAPTWNLAVTIQKFITIGSVTPGTTYEFAVKTHCNDGSSTALSPVVLATTFDNSLTCAAPTGLTATPMTVSGSAGARLSWNAVPYAHSYIVRYKLAGATTWTQSIIAANSLILSLPMGNYHFTVQTRCSPNSVVLSPVSSMVAFGPGITPGAERAAEEVTAVANESLDVKLYPNPATDRVTVQTGTTEGKVTLQVYNMLGVLVLSRESAGANEQLDFTGFAKGIYLVKVKTDKNQQTQRLVIE